ncbi:hypothetical protein G6F22_010859 [Rhizopus arrhizus]|nr:hypothetical protein G6F22_010859 [Rhizopus arrhizus]
MKRNISETFERLYVAKQGRAQDNLLNKKSGALYSKAVDSAVDIIDRALDIVKESTLKKMEVPGHGKMSDTNQNELENREAANIDDEELMGPARTINHSPNQPKFPIINIESAQKQCYIAISNMPLYCLPTFLRKALNNNCEDQKALSSLKNFPNVLRIIKYMMEDDVDNNIFPRRLWSYQTEAMKWSTMERDFFSAVAITMTDFWGLFMRRDFDRVHERTFWVDMSYQCESKVLSHSSSQMVPGVWNNTAEKLFADGIGRENGFEVIIVESSGPYSIEYIDYSMEDTQKLITKTNNSLRDEILKYQDASFNSAKDQSLYSKQMADC